MRLVALFHAENLVGEPEILALPGHDYPYRIVILKGHWVALAARLAQDVDYSNFKNAVTDKAATRVEGDARHDLYMRIWGVMHGAEDWLRRRVVEARKPKPQQTGFTFWARPARHSESLRGWEGWVDEDERQAIECEPQSTLPEWTDYAFDSDGDVLDAVIDNPTSDDIAEFEAALLRPPRRKGRGR